MTHRMIRNLAGLAVAMNTAVCAAQTPCPGSNPPSSFFWADDCNSPTIIVGYLHVDGVSFSFSNGRWTIVVATASTNDNFSVVEIFATTSGVDIESLSVVQGGQAGAATEALVAMPEVDVPMAGFYRFNDVRSISRGAGLTQLALTGGISGDRGVSGVNATPGLTAIGDLKTQIVTGLDVDGDVVGDIILDAGEDDLFDEDNSQLKRLTVGGSILGDIKAQSGGINIISARNGVVGTITDPIEISAFSYMDEIIGGEIYATITPGSLGPAKHLLRYLETTGLNGTSGDFIGTIDASEIGFSTTSADGMRILGNFGSTSTPSIVKVEEPLGTANEHIIVRIGGGFYSPTPGDPNPNDFYSRFELPQNGLVGRVVINAEDDGGVWHPEAKIELGSSLVLDEPAYAPARAAVGGGVAGLAPFEIYTAESKGVLGNPIVAFEWGPESGPAGTILDPELWVCEAKTPDVVLQFYGGVTQTFPGTNDNGWPVSIWSNAENVLSPGDMEEITDKFSFSFQTTDGRGYLKITRTTGTYSSTGAYEIRYAKNPTNDYQSGKPALEKRGGLTLQDVTGSPRQESFTIPLVRVNNCKTDLLLGFDLNSDDDLCTQDIAEWMNNPVDLNGDETTCSEDVARLVQAINLYNSLD